MIFLHVLFFYYLSFVSYLLNIYDFPKVKNYKSLLIAGAIAVGLYLFLHRKKILPMTLAQRAAWHEKVSRRMAQMDMAEKIRAVKAARKKKAAAEGTPETETTMTLAERMAAIRAAAEEKVSEEEQGTGFDYIRERAPYNEAVPVEDEKKAEVRKATAKKIAQKIAKEIAEKVMKKADDKKKADKEKADKKQKSTDLGYSKKKTTEDVMRDLLLALPRSEVKHTQEYGEESEEEEEKSTKDVLKEYVEKQKKSKDQQGYSKKKTTEDVMRDLGLWVLP